MAQIVQVKPQSSGVPRLILNPEDKMLDKIIYPKAFMKDWTKEKKNFQRRTHAALLQILKNKQTIKETKSIIE